MHRYRGTLTDWSCSVETSKESCGGLDCAEGYIGEALFECRNSIEIPRTNQKHYQEQASKENPDLSLFPAVGGQGFYVPIGCTYVGLLLHGPDQIGAKELVFFVALVLELPGDGCMWCPKEVVICERISNGRALSACHACVQLRPTMGSRLRLCWGAKVERVRQSVHPHVPLPS